MKGLGQGLKYMIRCDEERRRRKKRIEKAVSGGAGVEIHHMGRYRG